MQEIQVGLRIDNIGNATHHRSVVRARDRRRLLRGQSYQYSRSDSIRSRVVRGETVPHRSRARMLSYTSGSASNRVVHHQDHYGANNRHCKAVEI